MDDLSIRTLSVLTAVATHRSFRAAARELALSPSSVSHIVANVEKLLGIRLFLRNTRSVLPTEAGDAFLARVRPALTAIADAVSGVHDFRDRPSGLIRLNASTWGADRILPIVVAFMREHPDIRVDLVVEGRLVDIVAEGFDAGVRVLSQMSQEMVAVPLGTEEALVIVAAPDYLASAGTPRAPADLLGHECIHARLPSGVVMKWAMYRRAKECVVEVSGRLTVGNTDLAAKAAAGGAGIAYVEIGEAQPFLDSGQLVALLPAWTRPFPGHALYYPSQRLSSAAFRAFVAYVKAWAKSSRQPSQVSSDSHAVSAPSRVRSVRKRQ